MKTLIPDDEIKQLINIIGGENNIKGIKLKLWSLYIVFNDFQRVDIEGVKALPFVLNIIVGDSQIEISCKDNEQDNYLFDYFINNQKINTLQGATERILKKNPYYNSHSSFVTFCISSISRIISLRN